jgi:hypothetical protein
MATVSVAEDALRCIAQIKTSFGLRYEPLTRLCLILRSDTVDP